MPGQDGQLLRMDQASRLRRLARQRLPSTTTIAITSGKGGVGKSNIAVNLSVCLAAGGLRVTLVDVDLGLANADLLMNVHPRYTLSHVLSGLRSIEQVCTEGPGGLRFIAGVSGAHEAADLSDFERQNLTFQLRRLETSTDVVVLDCGAGISRNVVGFALSASRVVVVTTPEPTALADAYAIIKSLHRQRCEGRVSLFVNMANSRADARATYRRVAGVAQRFLNYSVADSGYMLHDTSVELAVQQRCPFVVRYPASNASACMAAMAQEIARTYAGRAKPEGLLRRVAGLFV